MTMGGLRIWRALMLTTAFVGLISVAVPDVMAAGVDTDALKEWLETIRK